MAKKAKFLGETKDTTCTLCFLIKSQNPRVKFHLYSEGSFYNPKDEFVCEHCLKWLNNIRQKCEDQCLDPEDNKFKDVTFWHDPKKERKSAIEVVGSTVL